MLDSITKRRIDDARDILVGKIPDPKSQVEQITIALIYKFMDDMDSESEELGGESKFFTGEYQKYSWRRVFDKSRGGHEILLDYREALQKMSENPSLPAIFHTIFRQAYLPYNDPETLKSFLKIIDQFEYDHSERLGDAFEYLLSILGSQGDAGQFRTPRHIIDFMVDVVAPKIGDTILDPACGTAGFLISAYKYILKHNSSEGKTTGDLLTPDQRKLLSQNICGYDISPDMVRLSLVNMYLHRITEPKIVEYDTLTSDAKWNEFFDVILANPPFMTPKGGIKPHDKFSINSKRSEALFVDYIVEHLNPTGRGAVIVPEGVIFKSDSAFIKLRKMLIDENYLYGVISLPSGVFNPYSGVKTSILLLDKVIAKQTSKILFAKIENDGFSLGAQRRPIEGSQLHSFAEAIKDFKIKTHQGQDTQSNLYSLVEKGVIAKTDDYTLSGDRYFAEPKSTSSYRMVPLGEICRMQRGVVYSKSDEVESGGIHILRANNININSSLDLSDIKQINNNVEVSDSQRLIKDDIFMCVASGSAAHIGKVAYIEEDTNYYFGGFMAAIRCSAEVLPRYLFYQLTDTRFNEYLNSVIAGANIKNINNSILNGFEIPLPSIEEQKAIVMELDGYNKIIDAAKTIVDNYHPQIEVSPDWPTIELGELIKLSSGNGLTSKQIIKGEYPIYGGNGIIDYHNDYFVEDPTIVIGRVGAYCGSVYITEPKSWITDNGLYIVEFKQPINIMFLSIVLKSLNLNRFAKVGGQPSISQSTIYSKRIPYPTIEIQKEIVNKINLELSAIDSSKELIRIFSDKINNQIAKIWNE